jgi:L-2-hydroxyglutarate oxidase LhgO
LPFLGIHTAHNQSGEIFFGPSSTPVFGREEYKNLIGANKYEALKIFLSFAKKIILNQNNLRNLALKEFSFLNRGKILKEISKLIKNVEGNDIKSYYSKTGIRSQIFDNHSKSLVIDFVVKKKDNQIHVLNAVSPAYTASFGFADYLVNQIS